jgi:hypothetical protein
MGTDRSIRLNVCLLPPQEVATELVRIASQLTLTSQLFRIDGKNRLPHLTLFMATFPQRSMDEVLKRLTNLTEKIPIECSAHGIMVTIGNYVEVGYVRTWKLQAMQEIVTSRIASMRLPESGIVDKNMTPLEVVSSKAHGYKLFGEAFRPHVTLAAYDDCDRITLPFLKTFDSYGFTIESLVVAESDQFGSVVRPVAVLPISNPD